MQIIDQPTDADNPGGPDSPVTLELLLDTLTATAAEVAELPPPLGLFALELEAGLAEALAGGSSW